MIRKQKEVQKSHINSAYLAKIMLFALGIFFFSPTLSALAAEYSFTKTEGVALAMNEGSISFSKVPLSFSGKIFENAVSVQVFADNCSLETENRVLFSELTPTLQEASAFGLTGNFVQNTFRFNPSLSSSCAALNVVDSAEQLNSIVAVNNSPSMEFTFNSINTTKLSTPSLTKGNEAPPVFVVLKAGNTGNDFVTETKRTQKNIVNIIANLNSKSIAEVSNNGNLFKVLRC